METIKKEYETPKEITEVGIAIRDVLVATSVALKDGFQVGTDLPVILSSAFAGLVTAISGMQNIGEEAKGAPVMSTIGCLLPIAEGIEALIKSRKSE